MGETVSFSGNGSTDGYLAVPPSGKGPGVVVIQEWWGLVPHITDVADRLAVEGYLALAPDLFHGKKTKEPDEANKLMMQLQWPKAVSELRGAISYLLQHPGHAGEGVGVIGFCMGGALTLAVAAADERVAAAVPYYGIPSKTDYSKMRAAVLGHFAEHDDFASPKAVKDLEQTLRGLGKDFTAHTYPGTEHAFFNDARPEVYRPDAAKTSWKRTLDFLAKHLS